MEVELGKHLLSAFLSSLVKPFGEYNYLNILKKGGLEHQQALQSPPFNATICSKYNIVLLNVLPSIGYSSSNLLEILRAVIQKKMKYSRQPREFSTQSIQ